MNTKLKTFLVTALLLAYQGASYAGKYEGTVTEVWVDTGNVGWISMNGDIADSPCTDKTWFKVDLTVPKMDMGLSMALAAQIANRQVLLGGTGNCSGPYELLKFVAVK